MNGPIGGLLSRTGSRNTIFLLTFLSLIFLSLTFLYLFFARFPAKNILPEACAEAGPTNDQPIAEVIDQAVAAVRDGDREKAATLVDAPRTFQEVERQMILRDMSASEKTSLRIALQSLLAGGLVDEGREAKWHTCRVHRISFLDKDRNEACVVVRIFHQDGTHASLLRLWVASNSGRWRVYDWEDADRVFRMSTNVAVTLAIQRGQAGARSLQALAESARFAAMGADAEAERLLSLSKLSTLDLPDVLEAARWLVLARTQIGQGRSGESLQSLDQAANLKSDAPALTFLRIEAQENLGNHERAVALAEEAEVQFGPDAHVKAIAGRSLLALGNRPQAIEAFRKGLSCDPGSIENLVGLVRSLSAEKKGEIGAYVAKWDNAPAKLAASAAALISQNDDESLAALLAEFRKRFPKDSSADAQQGQLLLRRKEYEAARKHFLAAGSLAKDKSQRDWAQRRVVDSWLLEGKPLEGYRAATDALQAYEIVAEDLLAKKDSKQLLALTDLHEEKHKDDPKCPFYRGEAHLLAKDYAGAEKAFADGMSRLTGATVHELFRRERVRTRYEWGRGLSAYEEIGPRLATFKQLAPLFFENNETEALATLIAIHRKNLLEGPELSYWDAQLAVLRKEYAVAASRFGALSVQSEDAAQKQELLARGLDCWLLAGNPAEGLRQAPDGHAAFEYLADRLVEKKVAKQLSELVEARRAKAPNDVRVLFYAGQALLLEGKAAEAIPLFVKGKAAAEGPYAAAFTQALVRALYKSGQSLKAYKEVPPQQDTFAMLTALCLEHNDADTLEKVVAAHASAYPDDASLGLWEAEPAWLRQDYQATVRMLQDKKAAILKDSANRGTFDDLLIRSLARLKRFDDAARLAKEARSRDGNPWYVAVVSAAAGDPKQTGEALEACVRRGHSAEQFHADPDIGPALALPSFKDVARRYPYGENKGWSADDTAKLRTTLKALELSDTEIAQLIADANAAGETAAGLNDFAVDPILASGAKGRRAKELLDSYLRKMKGAAK
jgi:hypothetical protein